MATAPQRLCHIEKSPAGYGFNLHTRPGTLGQFVGQVDPESPADQAGLRTGDKLVEVNGMNVEQLGHADTVAKIRELPDHVNLLVLDPEESVLQQPPPSYSSSQIQATLAADSFEPMQADSEQSSQLDLNIQVAADEAEPAG